jgi:hypothetical protein
MSLFNQCFTIVSHWWSQYHNNYYQQKEYDMYSEEEWQMQTALNIVSSMTVDEFQTQLEKHKIESNTMDNYVFDLAKALKESKYGR